MKADPVATQRIPRLTLLAEALACVDRLTAPVVPRALDVAAAGGCVLAQDVIASVALPPTPIALRDGWAVRADLTSDASSYAPAILSDIPVQVDAGDALPAGTDAVAPLDAVTIQGRLADVLAPVAPGEGVLPAGSDSARGTVLRRAGMRLRSADVAALQAMHFDRVLVRKPTIVVGGEHAGLIMRAIEAAGANATQALGVHAALADDKADAIIAIGGTGVGRRDTSVIALARAGEVAIHGIGLQPGDTAALGMVGIRPVLLLPSRLDAALAAWLVLGRRMLARLSGLSEEEAGMPVALTRKITSNVGLAELVPVRRSSGGVEPLASGTLPLGAITQADGYVLVPPDSEGFPAGSTVAMFAFP